MNEPTIPPPTPEDMALDLWAVYAVPPVNGSWLRRSQTEPVVRRCYAAELQLAAAEKTARELTEDLERTKRRHAAIYEASVADRRQLESQLAAIRGLLTPLLGTETCPSLHGTSERNIADGLSPLECVERIAKWWADDGLRCSFDDGTTGTRGDAWKKSYKEMRAERDELRTEKKILDAMYKEQEEQVEACGRFLGLDDGSVNWTDGLWEKIRIKLEQLTEMRAERDKLCEQVGRLWKALADLIGDGHFLQSAWRNAAELLATTAPKEPTKSAAEIALPQCEVDRIMALDLTGGREPE